MLKSHVVEAFTSLYEVRVGSADDVMDVAVERTARKISGISIEMKMAVPITVRLIKSSI